VAYLGFGKGRHGEGAEREPITGVWGQSPQRGPWAKPLVGRSKGLRPHEAETLFASECSMEAANLPIFLKFGNAKDHQTLLNFAILAENGKNAHFHIKSPVKKFHGRAKGGIAPCPPPKYATDVS